MVVRAQVLVGFAVGASVLGIQLETLEIDVEGELNLAGFLGLAGAECVPLSGIRYCIRAAGNGSAEQFEELHRQSVLHSPNAMSLARGVPLSGELLVLGAGKSNGTAKTSAPAFAGPEAPALA